MERNYAIDYFKFYAVYLVVCLHTIIFFGGMDNQAVKLLVMVFPRFVIPFFFITAGYLFGKKMICSQNAVAYAKKYIVTLIKLYLFWFLLYFLYHCMEKIILAIYMGSDVSRTLLDGIQQDLKVSRILYYGGGLTAYHLWFITALIWSIVILFGSIRYHKLNLLLGISLLLNLFGLFGQGYSGIFNLSLHTRDCLFFGLFYTTLGCFIAFRFDWIMQKISHIRLSFLVICMLFLSILQVTERIVTLLFLDGAKGGVDYDFSTIPVSLCFFMIILKIPQFGQNSILSGIGKNAVRIYVAHLMVISFMGYVFDLLNLNYFRNSIILILLFSFVILVVSFYFFHYVHHILNKIYSFLHVNVKKTDSNQNRSA